MASGQHRSQSLDALWFLRETGFCDRSNYGTLIGSLVVFSKLDVRNSFDMCSRSAIGTLFQSDSKRDFPRLLFDQFNLMRGPPWSTPLMFLSSIEANRNHHIRSPLFLLFLQDRSWVYLLQRTSMAKTKDPEDLLRDSTKFWFCRWSHTTTCREKLR